jgi:hypothetical protein
VNEDVEGPGGLLERPGQPDIRFGGLDVARGVVVHEDQGGGLAPEGVLEDFPGVDNGLVDDAFLDGLDVDDAVPGVQIDHGEALVLQPPHADAAIIEELRRAGDLGPVDGLLPQVEGGQILDEPEQDRRVGTDTLYGLQVRDVGVQDRPETPEGAEKLLRQGLHVPLGDAEVEEQLQRLILGKRLDTRLDITPLQALAVLFVMGIWRRVLHEDRSPGSENKRLHRGFAEAKGGFGRLSGFLFPAGGDAQGKIKGTEADSGSPDQNDSHQTPPATICPAGGQDRHTGNDAQDSIRFPDIAFHHQASRFFPDTLL